MIKSATDCWPPFPPVYKNFKSSAGSVPWWPLELPARNYRLAPSKSSLKILSMIVP